MEKHNYNPKIQNPPTKYTQKPHTNFRLLKFKRAKKLTNFTDPIHESYIPNQDVTSVDTRSAKSEAQQREGES
jgi:hypothetical protein